MATVNGIQIVQRGEYVLSVACDRALALRGIGPERLPSPCPTWRGVGVLTDEEGIAWQGADVYERDYADLRHTGTHLCETAYDIIEAEAVMKSMARAVQDYTNKSLGPMGVHWVVFEGMVLFNIGVAAMVEEAAELSYEMSRGGLVDENAVALKERRMFYRHVLLPDLPTVQGDVDTPELFDTYTKMVDVLCPQCRFKPVTMEEVVEKHYGDRLKLCLACEEYFLEGGCVSGRNANGVLTGCCRYCDDSEED